MSFEPKSPYDPDHAVRLAHERQKDEGNAASRALSRWRNNHGLTRLRDEVERADELAADMRAKLGIDEALRHGTAAVERTLAPSPSDIVPPNYAEEVARTIADAQQREQRSVLELAERLEGFRGAILQTLEAAAVAEDRRGRIQTRQGWALLAVGVIAAVGTTIAIVH